MTDMAHVVQPIQTDATADAISHRAAPAPSKEPSTSLLTSLAQKIAKETEVVDKYFREKGGPQIGFEPDSLLTYPHLPEEIERARHEVLKATSELKDLITGPAESLRWMAWNYNDQTTLSAVSHFGMAQAVPINSTATYEEISEKTGVDQVNLKRIMRHAMTNRIFREASPGVVSHTASSRVLAEDAQMRDWVGVVTEDFMVAAAHTIAAMEKAPASQEMAQTGFALANNTWNVEPLFVTLGREPARAKRFGVSMHSLSNGEGYEVRHCVEGYPWEELDNKRGTVVDVGGGHGFVCKELAEKFSNLKFVCQDLPKMVQTAPVYDGVGDRIEFAAHDFTKPQSPKGVDVFFFRWIFHNLPTKNAVHVLRQLIPGMKRGSKVVINDYCNPNPGVLDFWDERLLRSMDMIMLELLNSQERSEAEFRQLFADASPHFRFIGVRKPPRCKMSIMEAVWEGEDYGGASVKDEGARDS